MRWTTLPSLVTFPVALAHEATHWLAMQPVADDAALEVSATDAEAHLADIQWRPDARPTLVAVACLAPTILGYGLAATVVAWWLAAGGDLPATVVGWAKLSIAAIVWQLYAHPSPSDRQGVRIFAEVVGRGD
jgi:hypothetical protein